MGNQKLKFPRVLLKLSGELFAGESGQGIDYKATEEIARKTLKIVEETGVQLAIVPGGGNLIRGRNRGPEVDEATADYMGMLGTVINSLAFQEALERLKGQPGSTRVLSALDIKSVAEAYIRRRALHHLDQGRIIILAAGTGNPLFTTDTGAALRAVELRCNAVIKATKEDGIYSEDPRKNSSAQLFKHLTYKQVLEKGLEVMDGEAFVLCQRKKMPVIVFNMNQFESLGKILKGEQIGTLVSEENHFTG